MLKRASFIAPACSTGTHWSLPLRLIARCAAAQCWSLCSGVHCLLQHRTSFVASDRFVHCAGMQGLCPSLNAPMLFVCCISTQCRHASFAALSRTAGTHRPSCRRAMPVCIVCATGAHCFVGNRARRQNIYAPIFSCAPNTKWEANILKMVKFVNF